MTLPNNLISSDYFKVDSLGLPRDVIILLANSDRFPIILLTLFFLSYWTG